MEKHHAIIPGQEADVIGVLIVLRKTIQVDPDGRKTMICGMRVGGGIDQDPTLSPQGYPDKGIYVTYVQPNGPADLAGLQPHDKILQVNGVDMTMQTHDKACKYIRRDDTLEMIVYRDNNNMPPQNYRSPSQTYRSTYQSPALPQPYADMPY